jgi:hypothetical protein
LESRASFRFQSGAEKEVPKKRLKDLRRRPAGEVNGSKAGWAAAIAFLNSAGPVPVP